MKTCGQCKQPLSTDHSCGQYTTSSHTDTTLREKLESILQNVWDGGSADDAWEEIMRMHNKELQKAREEGAREFLDKMKSYVNIDRITLKGVDIAWSDVKEVFDSLSHQSKEV